MAKRRLKVWTWNVHGSYMYYLSHADCDFYVPIGGAYPGCSGDFAWGTNVHNVPLADIANLAFDCILYQSADNFLHDQHVLLSEEQRRKPKIYVEHDPPRQTPTDTRHIVDDPAITLVHVTHYNDLMWDCGRTPTTVIDHGVTIPAGVSYTGELTRGIYVVNNLPSRGRRLGLDIFLKVREQVPLDVVGMGNDEIGGLEPVALKDLPALCARYRFSFNPIRYTSFGLAICEAMMLGMPVVALATTEAPMKIKNGVTGFIDTDVKALITKMHQLLDDPSLAHRMGVAAKAYADQAFAIDRFAVEWEELFRQAINRPR